METSVPAKRAFEICCSFLLLRQHPEIYLVTGVALMYLFLVSGLRDSFVWQKLRRNNSVYPFIAHFIEQWYENAGNLL